MIWQTIWLYLAMDLSRFCMHLAGRLASIWLTVWLWICRYFARVWQAFGWPFGCGFFARIWLVVWQAFGWLFGCRFVAILHAFGWSFGRHLADCLAVDLSRFCTRLADIWLIVWLWICRDLHAFGWPGAFGMLAHTFHQQLLIMITHPKALSRYFN